MTPEEQKAAVEAERAVRQAPANADQATLDKLRAQMAKLDCAPEAKDPLIGHDRPGEYLVACGDGDGMVYLLEPMLIDGRDIADAKSGQNQTGAWTVNVDFKGEAQKTWADYTGKNVGKQTAVTLDTRVLSAPSINVQILGTTEISGRFTQGRPKHWRTPSSTVRCRCRSPCRTRRRCRPRSACTR